MEEKRKFSRLGANVNIEWTKISETEAPRSKEKDLARNISEGGVCLIAYEKLPIGKKLNLKIELPTGKSVSVDAEVSWIQEFEIIGGRSEKGYEVGAKFVNISQEDRELINKFIITHPHQ